MFYTYSIDMGGETPRGSVMPCGWPLQLFACLGAGNLGGCNLLDEELGQRCGDLLWWAAFDELSAR